MVGSVKHAILQVLYCRGRIELSNSTTTNTLNAAIVWRKKDEMLILESDYNHPRVHAINTQDTVHTKLGRKINR